jgi:hypothetical protein
MSRPRASYELVMVGRMLGDENSGRMGTIISATSDELTFFKRLRDGYGTWQMGHMRLDVRTLRSY